MPKTTTKLYNTLPFPRTKLGHEEERPVEVALMVFYAVKKIIDR